MSSLETKNPHGYWRSLDELSRTPEFREFVETEFPGLAQSMLSSRRGFLKIMGASLAFAGMGGMTGCIRWPKENIVPFARRPEGRIPGVPVGYASSLELGGVARPVVVTSYEGRPLKIEGNPEHPMSQGAANALTQSSILEVYDPNRSQRVVGPDGREQPWSDVGTELATVFAAMKLGAGSTLAILSEASTSPSLRAMREVLQRVLPQARWAEYEALSRDNEREGSRLAFGRVYRTHLQLDPARVICAIDSDVLMTHPAAVRYARDFATRRRGEGGILNQLHVIESGLSVTGSIADQRYPMATAAIPAATGYLASLLAQKGLRVPGLSAAVEPFATPPRGLNPALSGKLRHLADALWTHRAEALLTVGPRQPAEVHALVHALNQGLGCVGTTLRYSSELESDRPSHLESLRTLTKDLRSGRIQNVLILGGNPVFDAPANLNFSEALSGERITSVHLSHFRNETSEQCDWHLPRAHYLEAWGDGFSHDGTYTMAQPLIAPLYEGKSSIELMSMFLEDAPRGGRQIVEETFSRIFAGPDVEKRFRKALHDGFVAGSAWAAQRPELQEGWSDGLARHASTPAPGTFEVVFTEDHSTYDGRFFGNVWLQEMPDPVTKLAWDNAALMSPGTATALNVKDGDLLTITVGERTLNIPAFRLPGHADGSVSIPVGYRGPDASFSINSYNRASDGGGFNAYVLRGSDAFLQGFAEARIERSRGAGSYKLATTQEHHPIDNVPGNEIEQRVPRELVRTRTVVTGGSHSKDAEHGAQEHATDEHHGEGHGTGHGTGAHGSTRGWTSLFADYKYEGHRWGMSIDLSTCIGCSACVVACQAENNVPVVGKEELGYGREMHWLRIDRYFRRKPKEHGGVVAPPGLRKIPAENIEVAYQPVPCQQCENAPCEQVCPVGATMHSEEGLNDMVYNRCIGTRYCSNNCPFKVRRFNYFNNNKNIDDVEAMLYNPEVTIRHRGVMEKCTYCIQRISRTKIEARNERRPIRDGEITPACAQTCPTQAIVFGDLSDPNSQVSRLHKDPRSYSLLDDLNLKPRTHYLEKLINPLGVEGA